MTAIATLRRPQWRGKHSPRHGVTKILRGAAWKAGWVIVAHDDRLMPYPTGGFNNALTAANGGPLQVPGADANGGIRVIGKVPLLAYSQTVSGAGALSVTVLYTSLGYNYEVAVSAPASTTAAAILIALQNSQAANLLDAAYTNAGSGVAVAIATTAVPFVRVYGVSRADVDNSADSANDNDLPRGSPEEACGDAGRYGLETTGTFVAPAPAFLVDNQTVATNRTALQLPVPCRSIEDSYAFCDLAVGYI